MEGAHEDRMAHKCIEALMSSYRGTTAKPVKAVCVWLDSETDRDDPKWIVSLDTITLPGGAAEETETLHICDTEKEAMRFARQEAAKHSRPIYFNMLGENAELAEQA